MVELAPNFPVLLEAALALGRERRTTPVRWIGDQRGPVFSVNDGYPRAPIPIDLAVFLAPEPNLSAPGCTLRPSARDGPWVSGTITIWLLDLLDLLGCVDRALVLAGPAGHIKWWSRLTIVFNISMAAAAFAMGYMIHLGWGYLAGFWMAAGCFAAAMISAFFVTVPREINSKG